MLAPGFFVLLGILLLFSWVSLVGLVRAEFLRGRNFEYIQAARDKFGGRGIFVCASVDKVDLNQFAPFDIAMAFGVLHHLDDATVGEMVRLVSLGMRPGGRLVTIDPCPVAGQPRLAKLLIAHDRGGYVRTAQAYRDLLASHGQVEAEVVCDMLRVPFSFMVTTLRFTTLDPLNASAVDIASDQPANSPAPSA